MPFDDKNSPILITYQEERFTSLREEGAALFHAHWMESTADASVPLDLDWPLYERLEEMGMILMVTARADGVLIGYALYVMCCHPHYRTRKIADSDAFFIRQEDREGWVGIKLFQVAEEELKQRGVHEVWARVKIHVKRGRLGLRDLQGLFRWLGYRAVEIVMRKRIG